MSNRIHALAQQLTGKASLEECQLDEVRQIAQRFPYFAPAQFLFLQKLKQLNAPEVESQYRKAVLFYHDPLLFEYFISSDKFYVDEEIFLQKDTELSVVPENEIENVQPEKLIDHEPVSIDKTQTKDTEDGSFINITEPVPNDASLTELDTGNVDHFNEGISEGSGKSEVAKTFSHDDAEQPLEETIESVGLQNLKLEAKTEELSSELTFEPYHTIDYFASQGIKISQDDLQKDKLGKQLKSFTQWLKTMKRLPSVQVAEATENLAEKKVESMASRSVTESDIVTEAMADVWIKQGNKEKALDIYNKLSLLDPSKRAYFAAKIENLKLS